MAQIIAMSQNSSGIKYEERMTNQRETEKEREGEMRKMECG